MVKKGQEYIIYTFFLKYLIHVSSLSTNDLIQRKFARAFGACISNMLFFKPCLILNL